MASAFLRKAGSRKGLAFVPRRAMARCTTKTGTPCRRAQPSRAARGGQWGRVPRSTCSP